MKVILCDTFVTESKFPWDLFFILTKKYKHGSVIFAVFVIKKKSFPFYIFRVAEQSRNFMATFQIGARKLF